MFLEFYVGYLIRPALLRTVRSEMKWVLKLSRQTCSPLHYHGNFEIKLHTMMCSLCVDTEIAKTISIGISQSGPYMIMGAEANAMYRCRHAYQQIKFTRGCFIEASA